MDLKDINEQNRPCIYQMTLRAERERKNTVIKL